MSNFENVLFGNINYICGAELSFLERTPGTLPSYILFLASPRYQEQNVIANVIILIYIFGLLIRARAVRSLARIAAIRSL